MFFATIAQLFSMIYTLLEFVLCVVVILACLKYLRR